MKITRRQLRQLIREQMEIHRNPAMSSVRSIRDPESITPQDMADANRYAGEDPAAQAAWLGISVEDWGRIRDEMDNWYEERHYLDQLEMEDYDEFPGGTQQ